MVSSARSTEILPAAGSDDPRSMDHRRKQARRAQKANFLERRERLLAAAAEVIKEKGLEAASINDIAERFGAGRAGVYYYYASKHEIFLALVCGVVAEIVAIAETIAASDESSTLRIRKFIGASLDAYERHYPLIHLYIQENMTRIPSDGSPADIQLHELAKRYEAAILLITKSGIDAGEFRPDLNPQLVMFAILGSTNWTHRWWVPGSRLTGAEIGRSFADYFLEGIRSRKSSRKPGNPIKQKPA